LLRNELTTVMELVGQLHKAGYPEIIVSEPGVRSFMDRYEEFCSKARDAWAFAVFSDAGDETLERYFTFHMREIGYLLEQINGSTLDIKDAVQQLVALADHLYTYFGRYIDQRMLMPAAYQDFKLAQLKPIFGLLSDRWADEKIDPELQELLISTFSYLFEGEPLNSMPFGFLSYIASFLKELPVLFDGQESRGINEMLTNKLIALNFNHLGFFKYLRDKIGSSVTVLPLSAQIVELRLQSARLQPRITEQIPAYDPDWPCIGIMLKGWLMEEVERLEKQLIEERALNLSVGVLDKIGLELSVAQLACLVRALFDAGVAASDTLTSVFKFCTLHFTTKRQLTISQGSLSKEYYSISQKTAAGVLELLQKMTERIRRDYFPVVAAVSVIIFYR
jgi:hypothetical protein